MKHKILSLVFAFGIFALTSIAQDTQKQEINKNVQLVEASCGSCNFGLEGGCSLAVRVDGTNYPVEGVDFHKLGDPHSDHGMCNVIRVAQVEGEIVENKFIASSFKLMPVDTKLPVTKAKKGCSPDCIKACCSGKAKSDKHNCAPGCKKACCS